MRWLQATSRCSKQSRAHLLYALLQRPTRSTCRLCAAVGRCLLAMACMWAALLLLAVLHVPVAAGWLTSMAVAAGLPLRSTAIAVRLRM